MKTPLLLAISLAVLPLAADAQSRSQRKAERHVSDALNAAEEDSRQCRRAVLRDLRDIRAELSEDLSVRKLERVKRDVRSLERAANEECSRAVRRNIEDSKRFIDRAIEDAEDRARSRDRARRAPRGPRIDCWNPSDRACVATRDGQFPIQRVPFGQLLSTFQKTRSDISKGDLMKQVAKSNYFTTMQLAALVSTTRSDITRGDMVKYAAARVVDPKNAFVLRNTTRSSITADDMVKYVTRAARGFQP